MQVAMYLGRVLSDLDKKYFRAFVYTADGIERLVNSWPEYLKHMDEGIWFASRTDALNSLNAKNEEKPVETKVKNKK